MQPPTCSQPMIHCPEPKPAYGRSEGQPVKQVPEVQVGIWRTHAGLLDALRSLEAAELASQLVLQRASTLRVLSTDIRHSSTFCRTTRRRARLEYSDTHHHLLPQLSQQRLESVGLNPRQIQAESTMAPTRPTPGGSSANPIDLTATRPATATMAGSGTGTSTGSGIVSGPAADSIPGTATITGMVDNPCPTPGISGISTLFNATPLTEFDLAVDRTLSQGPASPPAPAAAGGILSGRVTKTKSTPKKATPNKKTTPKIPTTTTTTAAAAPDSPTPGTGTGTSAGVDSPNPPKRGKASGLPSCLACRRSKARCDRVVACERCIKAGKECIMVLLVRVVIVVLRGTVRGKACRKTLFAWALIARTLIRRKDLAALVRHISVEYQEKHSDHSFLPPEVESYFAEQVALTPDVGLKADSLTRSELADSASDAAAALLTSLCPNLLTAKFASLIDPGLPVALGLCPPGSLRSLRDVQILHSDPELGFDLLVFARLFHATPNIRLLRLIQASCSQRLEEGLKLENVTDLELLSSCMSGDDLAHILRLCPNVQRLQYVCGPLYEYDQFTPHEAVTIVLEHSPKLQRFELDLTDWLGYDHWDEGDILEAKGVLERNRAVECVFRPDYDIHKCHHFVSNGSRDSGGIQACSAVSLSVREILARLRAGRPPETTPPVTHHSSRNSRTRLQY
ncbi:predicted protein [Chaetomium globosum CBS 148.51]|uniref:Zn(2)-C6 fungal-type domain-containing protein n=1 Tax=Chaetomium globosum (strain ATCC 6205 / CBS 148.51 / DSM 1962 / NBRC 6347 / NRRL 1970) TaxID=306901 RepID=Q2GZ47_CHAGB|nr:uncharacterized protein CHGG_05199 [Chaetomium globosum CBS 148.51]EAQ88580.1 predicted protein [Chaetomium globosum CBS 148.51]